ncbi:MAG: 1-deoxy-D-xylulose-5-phosphate reductoisomerase [Omnitrophica bacterium GWA2_52_8]|nr:MAG: 1-deoxy-D-xylulose-5-phosphate reductoisomerase [Omnitrophica bacterium GWA2_52_8]
MKNIVILGSTGSIGRNTLDIVRAHPDKFRVCGLAVRQDIDQLYRQAVEFRPEIVCVFDKAAAQKLGGRLKRYGIRVVAGREGLLEVSTFKKAHQVICAMVGAVGLEPIFAALCAGKSLGIANKEPLVIAGDLLMRESRKRKVPVFPIDSEHSGLWQCLEGYPMSSIKKLVLTSSGGPFRKLKGSFEHLTPKRALKHPKWKMGPKITIDSATLMNKGLEVIEAANLFGMPSEKIDVLIHPEAIIHAMIEFVDGSHLAHLAITDMRPPIQYSLSYPERLNNHLPTLNFTQLKSLHFEAPDRRRFPCLDLGYEASRAGGTMPAVLNAANEVAVQAFLDYKMKFTEIAKTIKRVMQQHTPVSRPSLSQLLEADRWSRETAGLVMKGNKI